MPLVEKERERETREHYEVIDQSRVTISDGDGACNAAAAAAAAAVN